MNEQANIEKVQEAYGAFARGDIAGLLATLTEDVVWKMPGEPGIPFAGTRHGQSGAGEFFRLLNVTDEVLQFEPREFFAKGDKVVVLGLYRARARATGKIIDNEWGPRLHVARRKDIRLGGILRYGSNRFCLRFAIDRSTLAALKPFFSSPHQQLPNPNLFLQLLVVVFG